MEKIITNSVLSLMLLWICSLSACKEDPIPEFNNALNVLLPENLQDSVFVGDVISFDVAIRAEAGLDCVVVKQASYPFEFIPGLEMANFGEGTDFRYTFKYDASSHQSGDVMNWVIVAIDRNGLAKSVPYTLRVLQRPIRTSIILPGDMPTTIAVGEEIAFDIQIGAPDGIKQIQAKINGVVMDPLTKTVFDDPFADNYEFRHPTTLEDGGFNTFTIEVTDQHDNIQSISFNIEVTGVIRMVASFENVHLGAQRNNVYGQFLNLKTGEVYRISDAKQNSSLIDLVAFHSNNTGVALASPNDINVGEFVYNPANFPNDYLASWPVRNATQFRRVSSSGSITADNFDEIQEESFVVSAFEESGNSLTSVSPLQLNEVIAFKTLTGRIGVLIIRRATSDNQDYYIIDIKVQER